MNITKIKLYISLFKLSDFVSIVDSNNITATFYIKVGFCINNSLLAIFGRYKPNNTIEIKDKGIDLITMVRRNMKVTATPLGIEHSRHRRPNGFIL